MKSCIYQGHIRHRRFGPPGNQFRYRLFQMYLDLSELDEVFAGRWLWSHRRPALAWFRRADFLGDPALPLDTAVRNRVEQATGRRPSGPIRLLTHLRYFGYSMNPVSFYFCFQPGSDSIEWIVAEINNTPWDERHSYVLPVAAAAESPFRFQFEKQFHVSPFFGMNHLYDWRFTEPGGSLAIHMDNFENGAKVFDATLTLTRQEISTASLAGALLRYPLMTVQVIGLIYWQAFKLFVKRAKFRPHPKTLRQDTSSTEERTVAH